jgi:hypothetical protein
LPVEVRDALENKLFALVSSGNLFLNEARQAFAEDWAVAHSRYVKGGRE